MTNFDQASNSSTVFMHIQQLTNDLYKSGFLQLTFFMSLSMFPFILITILSEVICLVLRKESYVLKRQKYANWLFLRMIGRLNLMLNGEGIQVTSAENTISTVQQIQNEILTFKYETRKFLSTTIVEYSSDVHKSFRIDEKERSKLKLNKLVPILTINIYVFIFNYFGSF